jgi:hypothetical protein
LNPVAARSVIGLLTTLGLAVIVGAVLLWPTGKKVDIPLPFQNLAGGAVETVAGHVVASGPGDCGSPSAGRVLTADPVPAMPGGGQCDRALIAIDSGPNTGASTLLEFSGGPGQPQLAPGERGAAWDAERTAAGRVVVLDGDRPDAPHRPVGGAEL